jgi:hypothetical protein
VISTCSSRALCLLLFRLCLTLPKWRKHLKGTNNRLFIVIIYRDPHEVAESLFSKKKIPRENSVALWELYNNALLENSSDLPRRAFSFWAVMQNPRQTLKELAQLLGGGRYADAAVQITDKQIAYVQKLHFCFSLLSSFLFSGAIDRGLTHKKSEQVLTEAQKLLLDRLKNSSMSNVLQ